MKSIADDANHGLSTLEQLTSGRKRLFSYRRFRPNSEWSNQQEWSKRRHAMLLLAIRCSLLPEMDR